jgi:phospholipid/cholesterol/gamma-HCH transport system ATP-binding protein
MIEVRGLHKSFGEKNVLVGVDLEINDGWTMCIIGKSGCGKSVLLKNIVGLMYPDKGYVKMNGKIISEMKQKELYNLRADIGFVFQGAALFDSYTVFENVILHQWEHGVRDLSMLEKEAMKVLSAVGLLPNIAERENDNFKKEWKILKHKKPADLSGGMKKRVGVARALVGSPRYIFYDEPTTGLDPVTSIQIDQLIAELAKKFNVTSIVITHDLFSVYEVADQVIMLNDGRVEFAGTPEELKKTNKAAVKEFLYRYETCIL